MKNILLIFLALCSSYTTADTQAELLKKYKPSTPNHDAYFGALCSVQYTYHTADNDNKRKICYFNALLAMQVEEMFITRDQKVSDTIRESISLGYKIVHESSHPNLDELKKVCDLYGDSTDSYYIYAKYCP